MARRDEEKKRRRQKRLEKRQERQPPPASVSKALDALERMARIPAPASWPGASDPTLVRPDLVKFELGQFATHQPPGMSKCKQFEIALGKGPLGRYPEIEHWAWEEFLWHGAPGDSWRPIDAFLEHDGKRFPPTAAAQLRLWKEARIGLFEIGDVIDDTVGLQEWDAVRQASTGPPFRAITLNVGGVNASRGMQGQIFLTYVAPWRPEQGLFCGLGYAALVPRTDAQLLLPYLDLRRPDVVARPLPWKESRWAANEYLQTWKQREWHGWLSERLQFPFLALVSLPPDGKPRVLQVNGLVPTKPAQARQFGIYFDAGLGQSDVLVAGGTSVTPLDVGSANRVALAEYHAYRDKVGPPPGARDMPTFQRLR